MSSTSYLLYSVLKRGYISVDEGVNAVLTFVVSVKRILLEFCISRVVEVV
jgi:hypothetical protein